MRNRNGTNLRHVTENTESMEGLVHDGVLAALAAPSLSAALATFAGALDRALPRRGWAVLIALPHGPACLYFHGVAPPGDDGLAEAVRNASLDLEPKAVMIASSPLPAGSTAAALEISEPVVTGHTRPPFGAAWTGRSAGETSPLTGGERASVAVHLQTLAGAWARIERERTLDPLTGAHSRSAFERDLEHEVARAGRYALPVSLLMMDIDGFKTINDTHGHPAGDRALQALVNRLRPLMRSTDRLYRVGGDEFAAILPHTLCHGASLLERRLYTDQPWPHHDPPCRIALSIGSASLEPGGPEMTAEDLIAAADAALYEAKHRRRG